MKIVVSPMLILFLMILSYASSYEDENKEEWEKWKSYHKKVYNSEEEDKIRMKIFMNRKKKILEHNNLYQEGKISYSMKMSHFGDLLDHELDNLFLRNNLNENNKTKGKDSIYNGVSQILPYEGKLPDNMDWRKLGAVTEVKNQLQYDACASCWAFAAVGALEGQYYRKSGKLVSLSVQQLVECSSDYGNFGCSGGFTENAFQYLAENGGIETEQSYPYTGCKNKTFFEEMHLKNFDEHCKRYEGNSPNSACHHSTKNVEVTVKGYVQIRKGDEEALKSAVATVGPIAVAIREVPSMAFYHEGVFDDKKCNHILTHAVLAVGYGTERVQIREWPYYKDIDYWLVKNSYGQEVGINGYFKLRRNANNLCGIALEANYPLI